MWRNRFGTSLCLSLLLLMSASAVRAATLYVNCGGRAGLTSIGAALKALQYAEDHGASTINVSGACNENVVIQNFDRLTLNAAPGASINDSSGGNSDTVQIASHIAFQSTISRSMAARLASTASLDLSPI